MNALPSYGKAPSRIDAAWRLFICFDTNRVADVTARFFPLAHPSTTFGLAMGRPKGRGHDVVRVSKKRVADKGRIFSRLRPLDRVDPVR